jgi:hypothetical protein
VVLPVGLLALLGSVSDLVLKGCSHARYLCLAIKYLIFLFQIGIDRLTGHSELLGQQ